MLWGCVQKVYPLLPFNITYNPFAFTTRCVSSRLLKPQRVKQCISFLKRQATVISEMFVIVVIFRRYWIKGLWNQVLSSYRLIDRSFFHRRGTRRIMFISHFPGRGTRQDVANLHSAFFPDSYIHVVVFPCRTFAIRCRCMRRYMT